MRAIDEVVPWFDGWIDAASQSACMKRAASMQEIRAYIAGMHTQRKPAVFCSILCLVRTHNRAIRHTQSKAGQQQPFFSYPNLNRERLLKSD
jgi:hypothetical protein